MARQEKSLPGAAQGRNGAPEIFGPCEVAQDHARTGLLERFRAIRAGGDPDKFTAGRVRRLDVTGRITDENRRARRGAKKLGEAAARRGWQRLAQLAVFGIGAADELIESTSWKVTGPLRWVSDKTKR